jgi:CHAD domain-containing protein
MNVKAPKSIEHGVDREMIAGRLTKLMDAVEKGLATIGQHDTPKAVHDARIAVHRLWIALRHLKRVLPHRERKRCMTALFAIMKESNAVRDADVRERLVQKFLIRAGFQDHEQTRMLRAAAAQDCAAARKELRRRMDAPKWDERLWDLRQNEIVLLRSECGDSPVELIRSALSRHCRRLHRELQKRVYKVRQLHRLRLRIKDARYFAEDFGPLLGAPSDVELTQLRRLQKVLGDLHDEWRMGKWLRKQYKCYLVTSAVLRLLKAHKRKLFKEIQRRRKECMPFVRNVAKVRGGAPFPSRMRPGTIPKRALENHPARQ